MGRIKGKLVKRTGHNLLKEENNFTGSFEDNKKLLVGITSSKKITNQVAGYIARLKKRKTEEKTE